MGGYRTNEVFSDNKGVTKLNLPRTIVDPYIDKEAALGVQKKLKDKGFKYEKSSLTPVFGEDANGKILYAYPKLDDKGNILTGQYDWKNAVDVTYDIQNTIADKTAGSARTSEIIGGSKKPKNKM
jgi:L-arabinose isomerase